MDKKRAVTGFILSVVFLSIFVYSISYLKLFFDSLDNSQAFLGSMSAPIAVQTPKLELTAESAISVKSNLQNNRRIIFEKDSNAQLPIASLTKLMTAVVVLENYDLSQTISVNETADAYAPLEHDVKLGDEMTTENFLDIMLVGSSNKAAYALSGVLGTEEFVGLMNQKAREIGMQSTAFVDPSGLSPQNLSTVKDLVVLADYILENYPRIARSSSIKELHIYGFGDLKNTDKLLAEIPDVVFSKTGFTTKAKGCLLMVLNDSESNDYLISVVLGADDRFVEMKNLINWSSVVYK